MSIQNERFTVIFNTRGSNVLFPDTRAENVNLNQVIYDVNWLSILPTKYKNFSVILYSNQTFLNLILTVHHYR